MNFIDHNFYGHSLFKWTWRLKNFFHFLTDDIRFFKISVRTSFWLVPSVKFLSNLTFQLTILLSFYHFYAVKACGVVNLNFYEIFKDNTRVRKKNIMCKSEGKFVLSTCKSRRRSLIEIDLNNFTTSINISWNAMWDIQT